VGGPIDITEAGPADAAAAGAFVRELWEAAGPDAPGLTGATDEVIAAISRPEEIRLRLGGPERRIFLARRDGRIVGFAATRRLDGATCELAGIMVHPGHRGGVGTPLLDAATATVAAEGSRRMIVHTETDNEGALAFYEHHGFRRAGTGTDEVDGTGVPVVILERVIG
jgi:ribosomal protein S18 acetylase RimI-like enzyme